MGSPRYTIHKPKTNTISLSCDESRHNHRKKIVGIMNELGTTTKVANKIDVGILCYTGTWIHAEKRHEDQIHNTM